MKRLASIQILRALAAMAVALFHACQWAHVDFAVGAAGVDVFFVVSGFVLWAAAEARPVGAGAFLKARFLRVAPLYWIATLAVAAVAARAPQPLPIVQPQARHLVLSLLFLPHTDPSGAPFPLLPTGWTLTYEAFFYVVFALALAAPRDRRLQVLCGMVLAASLLGFGYHGWYTLLANPLLLEFLAGVGLARLWGRGRLQMAAPATGPLLIAGGLLALSVLQVCGVRDDFWRPFLWGPPATMIVAGALTLEAGGRLGQGLLGRALQAVGDASYSLYLVQAPVIAAFAWATPSLPAWVKAPAAFALAVACGLVCYRWIERPLGSVVRGHGHARRRDGLGLRPPEQEALAAIDADLA